MAECTAHIYPLPNVCGTKYKSICDANLIFGCDRKSEQFCIIIEVFGVAIDTIPTLRLSTDILMSGVNLHNCVLTINQDSVTHTAVLRSHLKTFHLKTCSSISFENMFLHFIWKHVLTFHLKTCCYILFEDMSLHFIWRHVLTFYLKTCSYIYILCSSFYITVCAIHGIWN